MSRARIGLPLQAALALAVLCQSCPSEVPEVRTVPASRRTLKAQVQATGVIRAVTGAEVRVGARISGRVERLLANFGDHVKKGAVIARLDDRDLRARVQRSQADLQAAKASLQLIRRGSRPEEVTEVDASLRQAMAEASLAEVQERRAAGLAARKFVGQEEADRAARDVAVARARVVSARSRLALVKDRYLPEDLALAEARVRQAEAALAEARATLSFAVITAPIGGVIAQIATQEGETVSAGLNAPTFVTLIDLDRLEVAAYVDEVDVGRVRVGQKTTFTVDSFPGVEFDGLVTAIYPRAVIQANVVNYITTVAIAPSKGRLKPDMTATVSIALDERPNVLTVPDRSLRREGGKTVVSVLEQAGPQARAVRVGLRAGGFAEVLSGLREGERVVVENAAGRAGARK